MSNLFKKRKGGYECLRNISILNMQIKKGSFLSDKFTIGGIGIIDFYGKELETEENNGYLEILGLYRENNNFLKRILNKIKDEIHYYKLNKKHESILNLQRNRGIRSSTPEKEV